jgi:GT2 family glycosyltransferase
VALINFNTAGQTLRCLDSLRTCTLPPDCVAVLDNASSKEDFDLLAQGCTEFPQSELRLYRSGTNLGFAAGSNFLIDALLANPECRYVLLLNNDAVAQPGLVRRLVEAVSGEQAHAGLAGGRMNRLSATDQADTLGIALYASLMPANRLSIEDPFLGPTGGCCLMTREVVERLKAVWGYCFDSRYFCYCEDTDLTLRAVLLGYRPVYVDELVALHEGQASTGGVDSAFIAYHGLRNLVWMHAKLVPGPLLVKYGPLLLVAHVLTLVRQALIGHFGVMLRVYRDAFRHLPAFWRERRAFASGSSRISWRDLDRLIAPRFYRKGYLREVLGRIVSRYRKRRP